jgi:type III secretion protein Q
LRARLHLAGEDYAALVEALPAVRSGVEDWARLPLVMGFRVGSASLTAAECASLEIGDIILLAGDPMAKGGIRLCAGDRYRPLWKATWYAGQVMLDEECEECKEDRPMEDAAQGGEPGKLDELEVQLTFDLGGRMATLGEVRGLSAGSILPLPENPDARVDIRASGKAIGTGSLIMIDGRAGVRVESLKDGGNP